MAFSQFLYQLMVGIERFHVPVIAQVFKIGICHAQFLSLIDIGRSLKHVKAGCQHLCRFYAIRSVVSKAGNGPGLVMVAPEQRIPGNPLHSGLPFVQNFF